MGEIMDALWGGREVWYLYLTILVGLWGACIGSFLNVCIHRIPAEQSIVTPRSQCPHCKHPIAWYHNIPVLSYVWLRARCAYCGEPIRPRYVLVELLTAGLFMLVWLKLDVGVGGVRPLGLVPVVSLGVILAYWLMLWGLILGMFVDFEHYIIPDRCTLGGIAAGVAISPLVPELHGMDTWWQGLVQALAGAGIGWGLLWLVAVFGRMAFKKDAMGFGDVKLLGAIGAFLGWRAVLFTIMAGSLVGSVVGITLVLSGKREMQGRIPFGPYLAAGALAWVLWGPALWSAYWQMTMPALP